MPASVMVSRGEAKGMATKQKASRAITKKELVPSKQTLHC